MTEITPGKLMGLRRLADAGGRFKMLAVDQRPPIENLVREARGGESAVFDDVAGVKAALIGELAPAATAVLMDPQYIFPSGIPLLPRDRGLLVTLEHDRFEETPNGRRSHPIPDWTVRKIRLAGGDAVKVLAWYRPDADPQIVEHQQAFVADIGAECSSYDIPFVFELLLYPFPGEEGHTTGYVETPMKRAESVIESVSTFADPRYGVDLFKLESPVPAASFTAEGRVPDREIDEAFSGLNQAAGRPWVMLSAGAKPASFERMLEKAYDAGASGYLAGRAIWWEACVSTFPDRDALAARLREISLPYMERINTLTDDRATPWFHHPGYGPDGPTPPEAGDEFRRRYGAEGP